MSAFRLLIIDDEAVIRDGFKRFLSITFPEINVITAEDGNKGLQLAQLEKPNLILLDLSMPEMTGFEVLTQMAFHNIQIPVIVMTAFGSESNQNLVRITALSDDIKILRKPVNLDALATLIAQYMK
jgi:CheY-like chemotaxis protein